MKISENPLKKKTILLRSSWQIVNIGDIAHTPGVLTLLEQHLTGIEVILWASDDFSEDALAMLRRRFPGLQVVKGRIGDDGKADNTELQQALDKSIFLLHGSGPLLVAHEDVIAYRKHTGKAFGVFGITYGGYNESNWPEMKQVLSEAAFIYFRDSASLEKAKSDGISCPLMKFGPDGAFAVDVRNDDRALSFMAEHNLEPHGFLCCITRYRYTPFWKVKDVPFNEEKHAVNEAKKEQDHADLRQAIIEVVRQTSLKVLICPEDMTQMELSKEMLVDRMPEDVRSRVVWREHFWLTDEALSVYIRSAGLFGSEMHSPIMCIGNGVPAIVCRWAEQTTKGLMWQDIGLGEWLFDLDKPEDREHVVPAVLGLAMQPEGAKAKALAAQACVKELQQSMALTLLNAIDGLSS
ncbi:polysaccharide pyruvyl transferase family protein [Paenibacillus lautus]|uniref:polysaccharide pyruvyl transferase family protein n=1 Tax=Paenibacillus lautus TaxID=1401 RepID=UPI001C127599|nr:polysaccharide pyruvyl transferase family protein [Paenibacillus lautus]MBU5348308.1 polysaccharide pyruvyl transferase family protein [Paenibacillus lautus]